LALSRLNELIKTCEKAYERYEFFKVYHALNNFFATDLSATYLDILKDRLYTGRADGLPRRASQTVIYKLVESLCSLMAPITSFLSDEVYGFLPGKKDGSIFERPFPAVDSRYENPQLTADFEVLLEIRATVAKELEELRRQKVIGSSLDAKVQLTVSDEKAKVLDRYKKHLREFLIVSQVSYQAGPAFSLKADKADGEKCVRCWHYSEQTGKEPRFEGACEKCVEALA
jgi:isoleucyl-tRNA synthetase